MSRFVKPESKTLKISQGDTITVKRRLNSGEQRAAFARMAVAGLDGEMHVNRMEVGVSLMLAYLLDWSLTDDAGEPVVIRDEPPDVVLAVLNSLDPESFSEIKDAIELHDAAVREERERVRSFPDGASESKAISPSPAPADGDTSGSMSSIQMSTT